MPMASVSIRVSAPLYEEIRTTATKEDVSLLEAADHLVVGLETKNEKLQKENEKLKKLLDYWKEKHSAERGFIHLMAKSPKNTTPADFWNEEDRKMEAQVNEIDKKIKELEE